MEYFRDHPEEFAAYLTEEGWEGFQPGGIQSAGVEHETGQTPEVPTARIRRVLKEKVGRPPVRKIVYARLAAASLILVVGLVFLIQRGGGHTAVTPLSSGIAAGGVGPTAPATRIAALETINNPTSKEKICTLADGSIVRLAGRSAISFHRPFIDDRREIYLKGAAIFTVAKLKSMPFTVHSGQIATTALGTVFSVDEQRSLITEVHLYSGRIVVKKSAGSDTATFKDIYLEPGQDLILDNVRNMSVLSYTPSRLMAMARAAKKTPMAVQPQVFTFNRQSLAEILDLLQHACRVSITYDTTAIKNIDFTGSFNKDKETIENFLSTLCTLNELAFTMNGPESFSIGKKQ